MARGPLRVILARQGSNKSPHRVTETNTTNERAETLLTDYSHLGTGWIHHTVVRIPGQVPRHRVRQEGSGPGSVYQGLGQVIRAGLFITPGN